MIIQNEKEFVGFRKRTKIFAFYKKVCFNNANTLNYTFLLMKRGFLKFYYDFFDKKIEDSTIVVGLIGTMIFLA